MDVFIITTRVLLILAVVVLVSGEQWKCPQPAGRGICVNMCSRDEDCLGRTLCCSNGCGHTCQTPVFGEQWKCPQPAGRGICVNMCSRDEDCLGRTLCCSNGCGHTCQTPVFGEREDKSAEHELNEDTESKSEEERERK